MRRVPAGHKWGSAGGPAGASRILLLTLIAICFGHSPAPAQQPDAPRDPDLRTEGLRKVGPFRLAPYFHLRDVGYDDNVFFEASRSQGDYTATAVPGLRALLLTGDRGGVVLDSEAAWVAFRDNSQLDHWNGKVRARGILLLRSALVSVSDRFQSVRERPANEIDTRVRSNSNLVSAEVRTQRSGRFGGRAAISRDAIRYVSGEDIDNLKARLDRNRQTLALTGELRVHPRTTAFLEVSFDDVNFRNPDVIRDTRSVSLLPGVRFDPTAPVQGELKAGVIDLNAPPSMTVPDPSDPNATIRTPARDYRGFAGEGALSVRMGHAARVKLTGARELPFSIVENNLYAVQTDWSAAFEQFLSRRFSVELKEARSLYHYPEKVPDSRGNLIDRDDRLRIYGLSFNYRLGDRTGLTVSAQRQRRDSSDETLDRTRNFISFGTTVGI
ncbi:MAG TPA: outer membrane beta-barrel protein [Candidatus Saccharimonadales bacterium]|nr:outer membrane beta-barrel protein [Candidatus Saccharimonadales bacterium]